MSPEPADAPVEPARQAVPPPAAGERVERPADRHPGRQPDRHRAPALWVVVGGIVVAAVAAATDGARSAAIVLGVTLLGAVLARVTRRGREPEGIAVRSTWWDTLVLWGLGLGILLLQGTPGV